MRISLDKTVRARQFEYISTSRREETQKSMSAQKAISGVRRLGKEAYQFKFTSEFEYIKLECNGTWRPTLLKVAWFRSHRKVESIPVKWVVSEDRGPNGATGRAKFKPAFSVGLVVTLYKNKLKEKFEGKEYKYYIQDESDRGTKVLAAFTIDLKEYAKPIDVGTNREVLEMTFHNESRKVHQVVLGMSLSSQLLKRGEAIDYDMQSTFSAMTSDVGNQQLSSDESGMDGEGEEGEGEGEGRMDAGHGRVVYAVELNCGNPDSIPVSKLEPNRAAGGYLPYKGTGNGKEPPTITMHAPTPDPIPGQRILSTSQLGSSLRPSRSPSPLLTHHTSSPSPSNSPSPSPSPSPEPPSRTKTTSSATAGSQPTKKSTAEKAKKEKKKTRTFFGKSNRVSVESSLDYHQDKENRTPLSPPPPSPVPTVTDSSHKPWEDLNDMVKKLQKYVMKLENEKERLHASMEIQGWLFKRGVRGVTANVWRRRFFRVEGSKIYYYKTICASQAQGFIDIDLVLGVRQVCSEEQDKNCSTFIVRCEGRTFQLQAVDQPTMKKWITAIEFLADFRKSYVEKRVTGDFDDSSQL